MEPKIISLKCANCGAKLEIDEKMDRFSCAYCGIEQYVERRGGTVSLRLVDAIRKVQAGTDKTAAELALRRLDEELKQATKELAKVKNDISTKKSSGCVGIGCLSLIALLFAPAVFSGEAGLITVFFILAIIGIISIIWNMLYSSQDEESNKKVAEAEARCNKIRTAMAEHKNVVDGP